MPEASCLELELGVPRPFLTVLCRRRAEILTFDRVGQPPSVIHIQSSMGIPHALRNSTVPS
jgi:hypothetical protein